MEARDYEITEVTPPAEPEPDNPALDSTLEETATGPRLTLVDDPLEAPAPYSAAERAEAWPEPGDPLEYGEPPTEEDQAEEMLVADLEQPEAPAQFDFDAFFSRYGGEDAFSALAGQHGFSVDELLRNEDFYFDVASRGAVDSRSLNRYLGQKAVERDRQQLLDEVAARAEQFGQVAEDPAAAAYRETVATREMVQHLMQREMEREQLAEIQSLHAHDRDEFVSGFLTRGIEPPPERDMQRALHESGMSEAYQEGRVTFGEALRHAHNHLLASRPQASSPASPRSDYDPRRNPRGSVVIPGVPSVGTGSAVPFRDTDPLGGGPL